jgi:hypothetical protein
VLLSRVVDRVAHRKAWWPLATFGAGLAFLFALPWVFVTSIETDTGWNDAIWQNGGTDALLAKVTTLIGITAASGALWMSQRIRLGQGTRPGTWLVASLCVQAAAFGGWLLTMP